jgi:hypothetical protein
MRNKCAAIKLVFWPDDVWELVKTYELGKRDRAAHASLIVSALAAQSKLPDSLGKITSPIHRYLLDGDNIRSGVTRNYLNDLRETWLGCANEIERHKAARRFLGKLTELQVADWLEGQGWHIKNLEAWGGDSDIECSDRHGAIAKIEVKFIGERDEEFTIMMNSLQGRRPSGGLVPISFARNWIIFRVYEAAKQLSKFSKFRHAIIVVNQDTFTFANNFGQEESMPWVDWKNAKLLVLENLGWQEFISKARIRYPNMDNDLGSTIATLNTLWIVRKANGHELSIDESCPWANPHV